MEQAHIAILTPYYSNVPIPFHRSLIKVITEAAKRNIRISLLSVEQTAVVKARNRLAEMLIALHGESNVDYVMHIDSDIAFTPIDFFSLIKEMAITQVPILSGLYYTRQKVDGEYQPVALFRKDDTYIPAHELFDGTSIVDAVGMGFMVCSPEVYMHMAKVHGKCIFEYLKRNDKLLSEDIVFCERAIALNYPIRITDKIRVGHYGGIQGGDNV